MTGLQAKLTAGVCIGRAGVWCGPVFDFRHPLGSWVKTSPQIWGLISKGAVEGMVDTKTWAVDASEV